MSERLDISATKQKILPEKQDLPEEMENISDSPEMREGIGLFDTAQYMEAVEVFALILGRGENVLARKYLAKCYFRAGKYEKSYGHFEILSKFDECREYAASMMATIRGVQGKYGEAIKTLKNLPKTPRNLVNLALMYILKYKVDKGEWMLEEARKILLSIDLQKSRPEHHWHIYLHLGMIYQMRKEYRLAESYYNRAIDSTNDPLVKGRVLNECGFLYIEQEKLDDAEEILTKALQYLEKTDTLEEGYNAKYKGLIYKERRNYQKAKEFLLIASRLFEEENLFRELAEVNMYLVELNHPDTNFYRMAGNFAEGVQYQEKMKEVNKIDAKTVEFILNSLDDTRVDDDGG